MADSSQKLFDVAKHLKDLNAEGRLKGFAGNEKGYAKIVEICRGCSIWLHHEKSDDLIIDLLVSPTALTKSPALCDEAIDKFKKFFGLLPNSTKWNHSIDIHNDHHRCFVLVNDKSAKEIIAIVDSLKGEFS